MASYLPMTEQDINIHCRVYARVTGQPEITFMGIYYAGQRWQAEQNDAQVMADLQRYKSQRNCRQLTDADWE